MGALCTEAPCWFSSKLSPRRVSHPKSPLSSSTSIPSDDVPCIGHGVRHEVPSCMPTPEHWAGVTQQMETHRESPSQPSHKAKKQRKGPLSSSSLALLLPSAGEAITQLSLHAWHGEAAFHSARTPTPCCRVKGAPHHGFPLTPSFSDRDLLILSSLFSPQCPTQLTKPGLLCL